MKVNENVRKEREAILKARREDIRRRKAERERNESTEEIKTEHKRNERLEAIKAETERIIKEREEFEREMIKRERVRRQQEELRKIERERKEKERKAKDRKELITAVCILVSLVVIGFALDPAGFIEYIEMVGLFIGIAIISGIVGLINSRPHYTKPHRYIVQDEINKNYKVEKGWHTTTFVPKNRR